MALLEVVVEVRLVGKAQAVGHVRQTRPLLEQYLGPVHRLVDLEGVRRLPKGLFELAYQLPATGLRQLRARGARGP